MYDSLNWGKTITDKVLQEMLQEQEEPMGKKKDKPIDVNNMTPDEKLKFEVAEEIGCAQKVLEGGWRSLSEKESGRIGGILNKRKRQMRAELEAAAEEQEQG